MLFMSIAWYYMSEKPKLAHGPSNKDDRSRSMWLGTSAVLVSKEVQYAIMVSGLLIPFMGLLTVFAPYAYTNYSLSFLCAPMVFSFISLVSTLWVQDLKLDDEYGVDAKKTEDKDIYDFTGGQMYASLLVLSFGLYTTMYLMHEHILTCRAFYDFWPANSIQYDTSFPYLISNGLF